MTGWKARPTKPIQVKVDRLSLEVNCGALFR